MNKEEAKEFLTHYICSCQYGTSPFDCDYAECKFGLAIRTLCDEERPQGEEDDKIKNGTDCMDEDAKQASIPYTYNAPQHDWKCGYSSAKHSCVYNKIKEADND